MIRRTKAVTPHILVIDDASEDEDLAAYYAGTDVEVIRHAKLEGPGGMFRTAVNILSGRGISCMITMDPTGQCFPEDLPRFFSYLHEKEEPTITIGCRDFFVPANLKAPDLHNRKLANFLFRLETGLKTTDALSGFCAYPVHYIKRLKIKNNVSDFQAELLIRAIWANLKIRSLRVRFAPLSTEKQRKPDLLTNLKLIGLRLLPCPKQTLRSREKFDFSLFHPKQFFSYLLKENATPGELAAAAFTGTYCAVLPLFGLHTPVVLYFATVFRLNRFLAFMIQHPFVLLPVTPFLIALLNTLSVSLIQALPQLYVKEISASN